MSLKETIVQAQTTAMKERNTDALSTLRMLTAAIKNEEIAAGETLSDDAVQDVVRRQVKQLKDARQEFESAGRTDLLASQDKEISLLETYLPAQLSEDEVRQKVQSLLSEAGEVAMGEAMGIVMKELKGIADGGVVRSAVSDFLQT